MATCILHVNLATSIMQRSPPDGNLVVSAKIVILQHVYIGLGTETLYVGSEFYLLIL